MQQHHQGSGDNVGGNKIVNVLLSKTVVIIAGLILVIGGVILVWFSDYLAQEYLISGVVREYEGEPSVGTAVDLFINGEERQSLTTNEQGSFEYLAKSLPEQLSVLVMDKQDTLYQQDYDQQDLEQGNITVDLDFRGDTPFRVTYWILNEVSLDLFFNQNASKIQPLEQSLIIQNEVYAWARSFYGQMAESTNITLMSEFVDAEKKGQASTTFLSTKQIVNQLALPELSSSFYDSRQWAPFSLTSKAQGTEEWLWAAADPSDLAVLTSNKYADGSSYLSEAGASFVNYLAGQELPKYFGLNLLTNFYSGCIDEGLQAMEGDLYLPDMSLVVLAIENAGDEKMGFSKVAYQENETEGLRYLVDDFATLDNSITQIAEKMLPSQELNPGERFVLPLYVFFDHTAFFNRLGVHTDGAMWFNAVPFRDYDYNMEASDNAQSNSELAVDYQRSAPAPDSLRFVLGSSLRPDALWVGNVKYPVRAFDPERLFWYQDVMAGASCPFVYTFNLQTEQWEDQGVIIDGFDKKNEEAWDEKQLPNFNGSVLIKEKEPETSFLNCLRVHLYGQAGKEEVLRATAGELKKDDTSYIRLDEGEEMMVSFEDRKTDFVVNRVVLHAKGYYLPYARKESSAD